jgi:hypothetical protein
LNFISIYEVILSFYPPWNNALEPNQGNIRQWLDNLYSKFQPIEQSRWNQSNIDTLFYAGSQDFINRQFSFANNQGSSNYQFNLIQQPVNMITGYERQHRKNFSYVPCEGSDAQTTDQYTKLITHIANMGDIHEMKSKAKELAAISGMVLLQPYLDFSGDDQAQGDLKVKAWEYNSFLMDPYWRTDINDAQFIWCQEYISKKEAEDRFPDKIEIIAPMSGTPQRYGNFYFLPENYNMSRNDLMVLSYVWYKWKRKKKRLYSKSRNQFYDFGKEAELDKILYNIKDMELVTVEVPCWKLATILNDQLMYQGENPLSFDGCPFIPYFWNYDPHIPQFDLRVRSLVRPMRSSQFLFNHKIITNADITEATINAGWKRKVGAVANEDNLKKSGQGWDVIINEGYELADCEKIIPSGVPESDLALADQFMNLIYSTSGINMENWSAQQEKGVSSLTVLLKQAANLMVFQKYFDQWDYSDKMLGSILLQIVLNNWNAEKIKLMIGEEPSPFFYSKIFSKFQVLVEESDLTPTQQNLQAQQMMDINSTFGREVFPPSMIIPKLNITGKGEIVPFLQQQEEQMSASQSEAQNIQHTVEEMKIKELMAKIHNQLSQARERDSRSESNVGLYEERMAEVSKNHAISVREKMDALTKLLDAIQRFGELETLVQSNNLESVNYDNQEYEKDLRGNVERNESSKRFMEQIMSTQPMLNRNSGDNQQTQQQNSSKNMMSML